MNQQFMEKLHTKHLDQQKLQLPKENRNDYLPRYSVSTPVLYSSLLKQQSMRRLLVDVNSLKYATAVCQN